MVAYMIIPNCSCIHLLLSNGRINKLVRFQGLTAASMKTTVLCDVAPCSLVVVYRRFRSIALIMAVASTSETSVNFYQTTRRNIPEYNHFK
jgi:hypothetical protein